MTENMNEQAATLQSETAENITQSVDESLNSGSSSAELADHPAHSESNGNQLNDEQSTPDVASQITNLQQQLEDEHRKLLTTLADMANLRKRTEKEIHAARKYALESFAKDILETVDNLERSLVNVDQQPETLKEFYTGIELTLKSLKEVLIRYDIKEINPLNQPFDHQLHTAISMQSASSDNPVAANTVISVVQKGYQLKDRLLRPAMVIVAQ